MAADFRTSTALVGTVAAPCVAAPNGPPTAGYGTSHRRHHPSPNAAQRLVRASCEGMKMEHIFVVVWWGEKGVFDVNLCWILKKQKRVTWKTLQQFHF